MKQREIKLLALAVCAITFSVSAFTDAQQPAKIPWVGFLSAASSSSDMAVRIEAFQQGLRALGYVEGKNIVIEWRYAEENSIDFPTLRLNWCVST